MKSKKPLGTFLFSAMGMALLILDSKTALSGAAEGLELCIKVVIPSLFPIFFLSVLLSSSLVGRKIPLLASLGRLCGIPQGGESLLLPGFLGGYPVGAQCIAQANQAGQLSDEDARRMLGFCCNAGPAFLFGMVGRLFDRSIALWLLWAIHILSALLVGMLLPGKSRSRAEVSASPPVSPAQAMARALTAMSGVCGWVILFRVILTVGQRWVLWLLPKTLQVTAAGFLELSNGCISLFSVENPGLRFILCSLFLGFGGLCVLMQTVSVTAGPGLGSYIPGKLLQGCISFLLSAPTQLLLFPKDAQWPMPAGILAAATAFLLIAVPAVRKMQNRGSIPGTVGV